MKSRLEIEELVRRSGIFKIGSEGEPEAVFCLSTKDYPQAIGKKTVENVNVRHLFSDLYNILSNYYKDHSGHSLSDEIQEIETRFAKILAEYLPEDEARGYANQVWKIRLKSGSGQSRLEVRLKAKLKATGAFKEPKKDAQRFFDLLLPLHQAFDKHLNLERETNFYLIHFLLGANIERGKFNAVYEKTRKFILRKNNLIEAEPLIQGFKPISK